MKHEITGRFVGNITIVLCLGHWDLKVSVTTFHLASLAVMRKFCWKLTGWLDPYLTVPATVTSTVVCPPTALSWTGWASAWKGGSLGQSQRGEMHSRIYT